MRHIQQGYAFRGRALEDDIQASFAFYRMRKVAKIYKFPIPTRNVGGKLFYAEKTGFDFVGHWYKTGKGIYIEAKDSTTKKVLPLLRYGHKKDEFGVKPKQLMELYENEQSGADAFVVWRLNGTAYRMSPRDLVEIVKIGNDVNPEIHISIMRKVNVVDGLIDFLFTVNSNKGQCR